VDALATTGDEGRGMTAISLGELQASYDPGISEWGNPADSSRLFYSEYIGVKSEPAELKHLSKQRKRKRSDSVSSGERKRISPNQKYLYFWGCRTPFNIVTNRLSSWKTAPERVIGP
jgi:hypothetical protein